jgi:cardiolipin synthase
MPIKIRSGVEAAYARHLAMKTTVSHADLRVGFELSQAIDPVLLVEGKRFYPTLLDDIKHANSSIHIIQFGVRPGVVADRFAETLLAKVREGVAVRMLVDARGSDPDGRSRALFVRLAAGGVEFFVNRPVGPRVLFGSPVSAPAQGLSLSNFLAVDHRKVIIIDGQIGWVGTAGIEDRFEDGRYHDLFVRVQGPILHQLQVAFLASYRWHGGVYQINEVAQLFPAPTEHADGAPATVVQNVPGRYRPISRAIVDLITSAQSTLDIMNPYLAHPAMFRYLGQAARCGVRVRLIVPAGRYTTTTGYARLYHHAELLTAGVEVWTYPTVAHAKAFVGDSVDILVGSCNLETWSLRRFFELDLRIQSAELGEQFTTKLFEPDIALSSPAQPARGVKERVLSTAFFLVSPFL